MHMHTMVFSIQILPIFQRNCAKGLHFRSLFAQPNILVVICHIKAAANTSVRDKNAEIMKSTKVQTLGAISLKYWEYLN